MVRQEQTDIDEGVLSGYILGLLQNASGTLVSGYQAADVALSGTLVTYVNNQIAGVSGFASGFQAGDIALSGYLQTVINNASGTLQTSIYTTSGYLTTLIGTGGVSASNYSVAMLTGLGQNFSGWYELSLANLGNNHPVNGVTGVPVFPSGGPVDHTLNVNGFIYNLDSWYDASNAVQPGIYGNTTASGGFSISFSGGLTESVLIKWNYTNYAGFSLNDTDNIVFRYQV